MYKVFGDKVHYAFSSAFSMEPDVAADVQQNNDEFHRWYVPDATTKCSTQPENLMDFKLGGSKWYDDGQEN